MKLLKPTKIALACVAAITSTSALASGHLLSDLGSLSASTAGAGSAAIAETAVTAWTNPAGMANLEGENFTVNIAGLGLDIEYTDIASTMDGDDVDNAGSWMPVASMYYTTPINDRVSFGVSLASQGGSGVDYGSDFHGSGIVNTVDLVTIQLAPAISYKVDDQLSLGAMINIEKANVTQTMDVKAGGTIPANPMKPTPTPVAIDTLGTLKTTDLTLGYTLSALYNFDADNRLGFTYRSEIEHETEGSLVLEDGVNHGLESGLSLLMPRQATFSGYHKQDKVAYLYTLAWTDFSKMKQTDISLAGHETGLARNFDDTWSLSVGAHYEVSPTLRLETGIGYESSALEDEEFQNPDLPTGAIVRIGMGANHTISKEWTAKYFYEYLGWEDVTIDRDYGSIGTLHGNYSNHAHYVGVQLNRNF